MVLSHFINGDNCQSVCCCVRSKSVMLRYFNIRQQVWHKQQEDKVEEDMWGNGGYQAITCHLPGSFILRFTHLQKISSIAPYGFLWAYMALIQPHGALQATLALYWPFWCLVALYVILGCHMTLYGLICLPWPVMAPYEAPIGSFGSI